jgi:hypothetical protein
MNLELFNGKSTGRLPKLNTIDDKIAAYELGLIEELSPQETEIRARWHKIWSRLVNFHSATQAVNAHVKACKEEGKTISTRTAWSDYRKATALFGNLIETPKKAKRILIEELAMKTFQTASHKKDVDGMNRAIANLIKINGLDRPDADIEVGAGGQNMYFMSIYMKGADKPKIINLDELNQISPEQATELLDAVEADEITEMEIKFLMDEENGRG